MNISRQAVTKCKISDNDIPYMVGNSKFDPTYCVPLVPNSYSVIACRAYSNAPILSVILPSATPSSTA